MLEKQKQMLAIAPSLIRGIFDVESTKYILSLVFVLSILSSSFFAFDLYGHYL
jgi:hypothetical protein